MNISNISNTNLYLNDNINTSKKDINYDKNNILKTDNIYNLDIENKISDEYVEKISSLSKGNISDTDNFSEGLIDIISDNDTQIKYGFQIFKLNNSTDSLTVGDIASYFYNQNKVSSSLNYAEKMLNQGMNKNSAVYKNDKELFYAVNE